MARSLRYAGAAGVATIWSTLSAASAVADFDLLGPRPLSDLGANGGAAAVLFSAGLAVSALLFAAFHRWVRAHFRVSALFSAAMLGGLAAQLVAAGVPVGNGATAHRIHTGFALILAASLPLLIWRFAASQPAGPWRRQSYRLTGAEVAACGAGLWLSASGVAPLAEALPAAAFHAWVLTLTFAPAERVTAEAGLSPAGAGGVVRRPQRSPARRVRTLRRGWTARPASTAP